MNKELTARVGADGVLTLAVPLGPQDANKLVRVRVETVPEMTPEEWRQFIERTAGSITDPTFERPPQGEYEKRDEWP